jgi:hypothetical protein
MIGITQEQYDKFSNGDTVTVVFTDRWNGSHSLHTGVITPDDYGKPFAVTKADGIKVPVNILPCRGGDRLTLIEHKPAPKPAWHTAKVIKRGSVYYLLDNATGKFTAPSGNSYTPSEFVTEVEIVVA